MVQEGSSGNITTRLQVCCVLLQPVLKDGMNTYHRIYQTLLGASGGRVPPRTEQVHSPLYLSPQPYHANVHINC